MTSRATLLAACAAAPSDSAAWVAAVTALGAAARLGFPEPPRRSTGLTRTALLYRVTQSRVFDTDRDQLRTAYHYGTAAEQAALVDYVLAEAGARKKKPVTSTQS